MSFVSCVYSSACGGTIRNEMEVLSRTGWETDRETHTHTYRQRVSEREQEKNKPL